MSELQQKLAILQKQSIDWGGLLGSAKEKVQPHLDAAADRVKTEFTTPPPPAPPPEQAINAAKDSVDAAKNLATTVTPYVNAARGSVTSAVPGIYAMGASPAVALIGALIGAGAGGKGNRLSGAIHGGARGFGTALGAGLGSVGVGAPMGGMAGYFGAPTTGGYAGLAAGGGLGGYGGYHTGAGLAELITGDKAPWSREKKKEKKKKDTEKQSKVYEAAESVENMPIKQTKMNHKKCTPGEFGAMVKEAAPPMARLMQGVGGAVGSALTQGAPQAAQKAMLAQRKNLRPVMGGVPGGNARQSLQQAGRAAYQDAVDGNVGRAALAGAAGAGAGYASNYFPAYDAETQRLQTQSGTKPALQGLQGIRAATQGIGSRIKGSSARDFGAHVKQSFIQQYLPAAGLGAGVGAGMGALGGLINPGEEDEYDDEGRVIGRKQRSRFGAMLQNALMGAGVGGLAGGAAQHFAPNQTNQALDYVRSLFAPQQMTPKQQVLHTNAMNIAGRRRGSGLEPEIEPISFPESPEGDYAAAVGQEYSGPDAPPMSAAGQQAQRAAGERALLARYPSAGGDIAMAKALDRQRAPVKPKPAAPMSPELVQAYGEEPTGQ